MCHDFTLPAAVSHVNVTTFVYNLIDHQLPTAVGATTIFYLD